MRFDVQINQKHFGFSAWRNKGKGFQIYLRKQNKIERSFFSKCTVYTVNISFFALKRRQRKIYKQQTPMRNVMLLFSIYYSQSHTNQRSEKNK